MIQSHPQTVALLIGTVLAFMLLVCVEGGFYLINQNKAGVKYIHKQVGQFEVLQGYEMTPNAKVLRIKKRNEKILYEVIYSTDEYGRRITPAESHKDRTNFLLFFGGSFTFGGGVNDNETMPYYVSRVASKYKPYNYGIGATGPPHMLAKLQSVQITKEIDEAKGISVYTFIDDHVNRVVGSSRMLRWGSHFPYFTIDRNERLIRKGNFASGRTILTFVYRTIGNSQIGRYFGINLPIINEHHIRLTSRVIEESRNVFRDKFNSDEYYVLIYPGSRHYGKKLIPFLEKG